MKKNGTGKSNVKVEQVTAISVSDTKQTKTTQKTTRYEETKLLLTFYLKFCLKI